MSILQNVTRAARERSRMLLGRGRNSVVTLNVEHTRRDHVFVFEPPLDGVIARKIEATVARIPGVEKLWWFRDSSHLMVGHRPDARTALLRRYVRLAVRTAREQDAHAVS